MSNKLNWEDYKIIAAIVFVLVMIVGAVIIADISEKNYLETHHCKLIHKNPDYITNDYNAATKTSIPKKHEGKKFYECDDGEWR